MDNRSPGTARVGCLPCRQRRVANAASTRTNQGESNVRSYTSLALGCVFSLVAAACGSSSNDPASSGPGEYSGPTPGAAGSNGAVVPPVTTPIDDAPDPVVPAPPTTPTPAANEGGPDVSELDPSTPPTDQGGGQQPPDDNANEEPVPPAEPPPAEPPPAEPPPTGQTQVFILFGQSNMWGVPPVGQEDLAINPRVEVLTMTSCGAHGTDQWVPAQPPLHGCVGNPSNGPQGPGLGPGDYFGKVLADAFPNDTILLVPNAIPGVSIDVFQPGREAYNSTLARSRLAQERGEIRGIIFHQGESDNNSDTWVGRVTTVVSQLRTDLQIGEVPFVAGELLYGGCCQVHNTRVGQLVNAISNSAVARADGLGALATDGFGNLHFDTAGQRTLGRRYGEAMLGLLQP